MATLKNVAAQVVANIKAVKVEKTEEKQQIVAALEAGLKKMEEENMAAKEINAKELIQKVAAENAQKKEENDMSKMTKKEIRDLLAVQGIEMSEKEFKKTLKADLIKKLEETIVKIPVVGKKGEEEMKKEGKAEGYKAAKWDKLVGALVEEYVKQSVSGYALFYKKTKSENLDAKYMVVQKRLWGATASVIKGLYKLEECEATYIQQAFNALCARGYLTFKKIQGQDGKMNVIFASGKNLDARLDKIEKKQPVKKQNQKASGKVYNAKLIGTMKNADGTICRVFVEQ